MQHETIQPVGRVARPFLARFNDRYVVSFTDQVSGKLYADPPCPHNNNARFVASSSNFYVKRVTASLRKQ
jgi:hypothetical protein